MRRVSSTLRDSGFPIVITVGANLVLLLCACVLFSNHLTPSYGVRVRPAATHFVMGSYDRSHMRIITVMPGNEPRFYIDSLEVAGGYEGLQQALTSWKRPNPSQLTVILNADEAVPHGVLQRLMDMVLSHGFTCTLTGRPDLDAHE